MMDLGALLTAEYEPRTTLWGPVQSRTITLIYGEPGTGKSFFSMALAMAMSRGDRFLGQPTRGQVRTLIFDGEMGPEDQQERAKGMLLDSRDIRCGDICFKTYRDCSGLMMWNLADETDRSKYSAAIRGFDCVVIDNLSSCARPTRDRDDEISRWSRIQPWLIKERDQGAAIVLLHHVNKGGAQSGTKEKENVANTVIRLSKVEHETAALVFDLTFEKHRHLKRNECLAIRVTATSDELGWSWTYETIMEGRAREIITLRDEGLKMSDIAKALNIPTHEVNRILSAVSKANSRSGMTRSRKDLDDEMF